MHQNNQDYRLVLTVNAGKGGGASEDPGNNKGITAKKTLWNVSFGSKEFSLGVKTKSKGKITYKSNSPIAVVDKAGKVTAKGYGEAKIVDVKKNKTASAVLKKLYSKKKYYVQVHSYKIVKKQHYAGKWSAVKKVRVK